MDPIADFLTHLRNAALVLKTEVILPVSRERQILAELLKREGYLAEVSVVTIDSASKPKAETDKETKTGGPIRTRDFLKVVLHYQNRQPVISRIRRISTPGRRVYVEHKHIPRPKNGLGTIILTTSKGILTDREARKLGVGGELICEVIRGQWS